MTYSAYIIDSAAYSCQKLFDLQADTPHEVLAIARDMLEKKGIPVHPPYCIDVRIAGAPPYDMVARLNKVYGL